MDKRLLAILISFLSFSTVAFSSYGYINPVIAHANPAIIYHAGLLPVTPYRLQGSSSNLPPANYDEQLGVTFTQDFTSLSFNVTAVAQTDSYGYGPAYLLNGLSNTGYWYQVGLSYNWPYKNGGYVAGFQMNYEAFNSSGNSVFPAGGGGGIVSLSGPVNAGDKVDLSLYFTNSDQVVMAAVDLNTGASAIETYSAGGASYFVGLGNDYSNSNGFFTGLMTEMYHVNPYYGSEKEVAYFEQGFEFTSAWLWIDEYNTANASQVLFSPSEFVQLTNSLYPFSTNGAVEYASTNAFVTGPLQLSLASFTSQPETSDLGMPVKLSFSSLLNGGVPPYTYYAFIDGKTMSNFTTYNMSNNYSFYVKGLNAGQHMFYVKIIDSQGHTTTSPSYTITVNPDPVLSLDIAQATYDLGQNFRVSAAASGGTPPYTIKYYLNGTQVGSSMPAPDRPGNYMIYAQLVDSAGYTVYSQSITLRVNPDPSISILLNSSTYDVGQHLGIITNGENGTPPYSVIYYINGSPIEFPASTPTRIGTYLIYASLTDSLGYRANSSVIAVRVNSDPVIRIYAPDEVYDAGQLTHAYSNATGGTPPYVITYYLNGSRLSNQHIIINATGMYSIIAELSDAAGYKVYSNALHLMINPDPSVSSVYAASSNSLLFSDNIISANIIVTNGTAPYIYTWYLNGQEIANTTTPAYTYHLTKMGLNALNITITDAAGYAVSKYITVNFSYNYTNIAIILLIAAIAIFSIFTIIKRRRTALHNL